MKTTPQVTPANTNTTTDNQNAKGSTGKFTVTPAEPVALSDLLKQAHADTAAKAADVVEPKPYPVQAQPEPAKPEATATAPEPAKAPAQPEPQKPAAPVRSRGEEIEFQIAKSGKLQLINNQLQSLKAKQNELNQFSFAVSKDEDYRYGRLVIFDDNNREFQCKNHGLAALIVEHLKGLFEQKVEEKESELLAVSRS
ncbi:hypothetical protein [Spirosoma rhododendri]|uniref:Uncharacterized protein n=1 Tax=Spirosoma rhododendri TaxID=2728024 RepID=A0A7L5DM46_9BACT|nr:hypothetical protein [Spirosoma rhododendri]QJD79539.1 hypothetical protein HH216_14805 [Spirosoma rhododendri]